MQDSTWKITKQKRGANVAEAQGQVQISAPPRGGGRREEEGDLKMSEVTKLAMDIKQSL
jgi:hypothetical protein